MDSIRIPLENNQYILEVNKQKRFYSFNKFGQYNITLSFKDIIGNTIVEIHTTEKEYYKMLLDFNYFCTQAGIINDIIHFDTGDTYSYFFFISFIENSIPSTPSEEDPRIGISIFQKDENYSPINPNNSILRLYIELSLYSLEDLNYNLYHIISDIEYINEINTSLMNDIFDGYMERESYDRYIYNMYKGDLIYEE